MKKLIIKGTAKGVEQAKYNMLLKGWRVKKDTHYWLFVYRCVLVKK